MDKPEFEIVSLRSGYKSLRCLIHNETFHPDVGPAEEARIIHVDQQRLVERSLLKPKFILWDVGLGAAANALAALSAWRQSIPFSISSNQVEIHSFDISRSSLNFALLNREHLSYLQGFESIIQKIISDGEVQVTPQVKWVVHWGDFREVMLKPHLPKPDSIIYDPYSAATNTEMWTLDHFQRLYRVLDPNKECVMTNYTRSTAVRVTWLLAGFYVGRGVSIGQKSQTTVASNFKSALEQPLGVEWLKTVEASRNSAPLVSDQYIQSKIESGHWDSLLKHSQWA